MDWPITYNGLKIKNIQCMDWEKSRQKAGGIYHTKQVLGLLYAGSCDSARSLVKK